MGGSQIENVSLTMPSTSHSHSRLATAVRAVTLICLPLCALATIGLFVTLIHDQLTISGMPAMLPSKHTSPAGYIAINRYFYHFQLWSFVHHLSLFVALLAGLIGMASLYLWLICLRPAASGESWHAGLGQAASPRIFSFAAVFFFLFACAAATTFFLSLPTSLATFLTPPSPPNPPADHHYAKFGWFAISQPSILSRATVHYIALPLVLVGLVLQLFCCLAWTGKRLQSQASDGNTATLGAAS